MSVDWDELGNSCAPFVPDLKDGRDTKYFDVQREKTKAKKIVVDGKIADPVIGFSYAGKHGESMRHVLPLKLNSTKLKITLLKLTIMVKLTSKDSSLPS